MRPINNRQLRRAVTFDGLQAASETVGRANEMTWENYLRNNPDEAANLRTWLWALGSMKCWFSEAILQQGEGHIEHFRPKGKMSGTNHPGYKWRMVDWKNFRLAHPTVNFRKKDFRTRQLAGKGSCFPLRDPGRRAQDAEEEVNEEPVLLDPVI